VGVQLHDDRARFSRRDCLLTLANDPTLPLVCPTNELKMKKLLDITTGWIAIITVLVPLACPATALIPLVNHSDAWRYHKGTTEPQADYLEAITNAPPSSNSLSGVLTVNTTLYASNSPYSFTGSVTVNSGIILTIEPGTTIYMASGIDFTVAAGGQVLAEGTDLAPIRFTRASGNPLDWGGITINGNSNSPETRLVYCHFEGNGKTCN